MGATKRKTEMSDLARSNKMLLVCYVITTVVLDLAYLVEVIKGSRDIVYYAIFLLLSLTPLLIALALYRKNVENKVVRYVVAYGYGVLYTFVIFTTFTDVAFVYAIPMMIAITVYANKNFAIRVGIGVIVVTIAQAIYQNTSPVLEHTDMATIEVKVFSLLLCVVYSIIVTDHFMKTSKSKIQMADEARSHSDELLDKVMNVSENMAELIGNATTKVNFLHESMEKTMSSMQEVNSGTGDTVTAVQNQLEKTEQIQSHIANVEQVSNAIKLDMTDAGVELEEGNRNMNMLLEQVEATNEASARVGAEMQKLAASATQMETIINVIENVTEQTSLLALNASIEAARAGEVGKGFAVVASEISSLASQTSSATVEITDLINNVSAELKAVVDMLQKLEDSNKIQGEKAERAVESFKGIDRAVKEVGEQSASLERAVNDLAVANGEIVENIQTISAITEEVTAHSSETYSSSEENDRTASEVMELVNRLNSLAQELKQDK
ncbi:MAG: methyl-accepting chemotaxis protein [Alistipes sp.]|nr:methyl-accepting chemotaxis protein [Alistipes sp.]